MENITIVGAGSWGCALARILGDNGHNVLLYDIDKDAVDEINTYHTNKNKLLIILIVVMFFLKIIIVGPC